MEYQPDPSALPTNQWSEVYLSNRDLTYQIPINFVTHPGVSVTAACFANRTYSAVGAGRCISNLLAAQYRRFVFDLYWDASARQFGLCPVGLPPSAKATTKMVSTPSVLTSARISTVRLTNSPTHTKQGHPQQARRDPSPLPLIAAVNETPSTSSQIPVETTIRSTGETLFSLGSYQCSQNLDIHSISPLILSYLQNTSDTINARLLWLEFNLHAATSANAQDDPPKAPSNGALPTGGELVGQVVNSTMQTYIYTPPELASDRSDLNESWYDGLSMNYPDPGYYSTQKLANGVLSTSDGWPTEGYVQFTKLMRVILGWGTIDPQMANYNFADDAEMIFPQGYLSQPRPIQADGIGQVTSGCFFDASVAAVSQVNSSWALSSLSQQAAFLALANNLTACGISPILNMTLANTSADNNATLYTSFSHSAVWNWAPGEPRNISVPGSDNDYPQSEFSCALMGLPPAYAGHWRVEYCTNKYRAACRIDNQPYKWVLSSNEVSFYDAPYSCPDGSTFSAPRTGVENHYLYHAVLSGRYRLGIGETAKGVWLNFNSIDIATCWVTTGPDGTCPYYVNEKAVQSRQVLVPTIGAIIVFVLTALTMFVKCNVNRQNSRSRRRGAGGWDYEGVPA